MAAVAVETVRQQVATALEAVSGWTESTYLSPLWDSANMLGLSPHKRFGVFPSSTTTAGRRETQKIRNRPGGSMVTTRLDVRWMWRVRSDSQVADLDAALAAERTLISAAVSDPAGTDVRWVLVSATRRPTPDGEAAFIDGTFSIDCLHQIDLE